MHGREYYIRKAKEQRGLSDETINYFLDHYADFTLLPYYATWVKKGATKEEALQMIVEQYGPGKIRDIRTGTELHPGEPELCQGNGEHPGFECCCDNCSGYLACFPEWKAQLQKQEKGGRYMTYKYEHKGYQLQQTDYNWHYMIIELATGRAVMHVPHTKKLSEAEAEQCIEDYLKLHDLIEE